MTLTSVTPSKGYKASTSYSLPTDKQRVRELPGVDDSYQPARSQGKHYGGGAGAPFFSGGMLDCIFQLTPGFAETRGFTTGAGYLTDQDKSETALSEFVVYVVSGGLLTVTDTPPANYKFIGTDGLFHSLTGGVRTCTARYVAGSLNVAWQDGGTVAEINIQLENPVAYWTCPYSGGVALIPFH